MVMHLNEKGMDKIEQKYLHQDRIFIKDFVYMLKGCKVIQSMSSGKVSMLSNSSSSRMASSAKKHKSRSSISSSNTSPSPVNKLLKTPVYNEIDLKTIDLARQKDKNRKYTLSTYRVTMSNSLNIIKPMANEFSHYSPKMSHARRIQSDIFFNMQHICNNMLDSIRKFAQNIHIYHTNRKLDNTLFDWNKSADRHNMVDHILNICDASRKLIKRSPRVVYLTSPCIVLGDIHGNLHDLLLYEKAFWKHGPYLSPVNYVFLGDYVDRG